MNLNTLVRSKQRRLFGIILAAAAVIIGGLYLANRGAAGHTGGKEEKPDRATAEPDLTGGGVVNAFDGSAQGSLLVTAQNREKEAREQLSAMQKDFKSLKDQMSDVMNNNKSLQQNVSDLMEQLKNQQNQQKQAPAGQQAQQGAQQGAGYTPPRTEYSFAPAPVQTGQIDNQTFDYSQFEPKTKDASFWVPTGTFSDAIIIEGADANASVRGENNLVPMQFKLKGRAHMPGNNKMVQLDNCFVTAAAYGDISSERAIVQLQRLSCIIDGKHIDQAVKGHVAFYGKNGIKGVPVMRNGKILGLAFTAGALGGLGQSASQVGQTVTGIGATSTVSGGDVARGAIGGGVGKAADKLADYYIERAEQYHPIIPIGAANRVEVVFIEGFRAKFIEDEEAAKLAKEQQRAGGQQQDTQTREQGNSGLPPDLVGKLGDATRLNMNDFVTPTNGGQARNMTPQGVAQ
ncbi:MAG: TrbI/VirB10 family protein [Mixta calida]|uniref:TrbI/VirB10 family protein n=1 Tax=Mixta calida TaxID=665913 RepID=UPI00290B9656|nr:TrbI/VirB10 family protein [Mixta calida]MDU4943545.1 TrbI/VirB10 family protein [Mixta calida]